MCESIYQVLFVYFNFGFLVSVSNPSYIFVAPDFVAGDDLRVVGPNSEDSDEEINKYDGAGKEIAQSLRSGCQNDMEKVPLCALDRSHLI